MITMAETSQALPDYQVVMLKYLCRSSFLQLQFLVTQTENGETEKKKKKKEFENKSTQGRLWLS